MNPSKILIIEDDRDSAEYYRTVLNLIHFEVEIALSAKEALARLSALVPDLILLDMRLGGDIGGEDILYQVRSNPRFENTRVIVITGFPTTVDRVTSLADLILIKPVAPDLLQTLATRISSFDFAPKRTPFRDPVTGLFNQEFFTTRLELAFERSKRKADFIFSVFVIQIQLQSQVEQPFPPELAMSLLRAVAERLKHNLRPTDTVARLASWKFASLHEDLRSPADVQVILERLRRLLQAPIEVDGQSFYPQLTFGDSNSTEGFSQAATFLDQAERVLEQALKASRPESL